MSDTNTAILMLGCFDTKGEDFEFLRSCLLENGKSIITMNTGVMEPTVSFPADIAANKVALAGGSSISDLRKKSDRGHAIEVMGRGAAVIAAELIADKKIRGVIGMGGGAGTYIALTAMQEVPLGIPKLCLSTLATKDVSRQIGHKDITLMPSIVDVAGLNSISRRLIRQAAAAICAMSDLQDTQDEKLKGTIAISMFGNTTACVNHCTELLRKNGYEVMAFHANGIGGRNMEALIRENCFDAVLDITTTELADDLCGGICSAGADRLTAAADMNIPQVVVPGCLDMVNFAHLDTVPGQFSKRTLYSWAPDVTLMRTDKEENTILGERLAEKVNRSSAPVRVLLPMKGISQVDAEGGIFYRPDFDAALFDAIKKNIKSPVKCTEVDAHINDKEFSEKLVNTLLEILDNKTTQSNYA